ncbi:hypothetical protein EJB05_13456, partial [Eragrostis curvula]
NGRQEDRKSKQEKLSETKSLVLNCVLFKGIHGGIAVLIKWQNCVGFGAEAKRSFGGRQGGAERCKTNVLVAKWIDLEEPALPGGCFDSSKLEASARHEGRCLSNCLLGSWRKLRRGTRMMLPWGVAVCVVDMVWAVLTGWVSMCLVVANEVARAMRSGEIG